MNAKDRPPDDNKAEPVFGSLSEPGKGLEKALEELDSVDLNRDPTPDSLEFEAVQRRTPKRRRGKTLLLLVVLIAAGAGAWFQWGDQLRPNQVEQIPVVRADVGQIKVKPDQPGGLDIPNRDKLVYDRLEAQPPAPRAENLLPRPEVPLPPPSEAVTPVAETATPDMVPQTPPIAADNISKTERPSPTEVQSAKVPAPPPPPPAVKAEKQPEPAAAPTTPAAPAAPSSSAQTAAKTPSTPAASPSGDFSIQLAAVRSDADARKEWERLRGKHASLLGPLRLNVVRANLGSKGIFYRLRAGPVSSLAAARTLCAELGKQKVSCLVVRPGS